MKKRLAILGGIGLGIASVVAFVAPTLTIPQDIFRKNIIEALDNQCKPIHHIGPISFHWPNQFSISYLTLHGQGQNQETQSHIEEIQGSLKYFPLFRKKCVVKKLSIRRINYKNCLLLENLVTKTLSYKNGVVFVRAQLNVNDGPTTLSGTIDFQEEKPKFDIHVNAKDIHITQDISALQLLPIFRVDKGELGGILGLNGSFRSNGFSKENLDEKAFVDLNLSLKEGYIKGNRLLTSLSKIIGIKNIYSFDSMDAAMRIEHGKVVLRGMNIQGPIMGITVSGTSELNGDISYDATVNINKEFSGRSDKKINCLLAGQKCIPLEIRGNTRDPIVAVKISKDNFNPLIKGLANEFFSDSQRK